MTPFLSLLRVNLLALLRDRLLYVLAGTALSLLVLVPVFSLFSMRQLQELSVTLCLSTISALLLLLAVLLGSAAVWRDLERRYTAPILGLPLSRTAYVLAKFAAVACFLLVCAVVLGLVSAVVIHLAAAQYPSARPLIWGNIAAAVAALAMKYVLLAAAAVLFSALSTSLFLPVFGTLSLYLAGSASQEVMDYLVSGSAAEVGAAVQSAARVVYYLLPNLAAFDLKVYAVYSLPLDWTGLLYTVLYFLVYTALLLCLAVLVFRRRELA